MTVRLKVIQGKKEGVGSCHDHPDRCDKCPLNVANGGRCKTCSSSKLAACDFSYCNLGCNTCGGYDVDVPAVCCKSPLALPSLRRAAPGGNFQQPKFRYEPQDVIELESRAIVVARGGGVKSTVGPPYVDEMDAVATTVPDVWSKKGFFSNDLKDYLRVPKEKKLILLTTMKDDVLEDCWETETFGGEEFERVGVDYWMPLTFSTYLNDGHMNRYYQMLRTLTSMQRGRAHFVSLPSADPNPALVVEDLWLEAVEKIKQVIFSCQFLVNDDLLRKKLTDIARWHKKVPESVPFWFIGMATPKFCHNVKKLTGSRRRYFVSANAFRLAGHGKQLLDSGGALKSPSMTKEELMFGNQRTFKKIVEKWG